MLGSTEFHVVVHSNKVNGISVENVSRKPQTRVFNFVPICRMDMNCAIDGNMF
jgi:hypothetical protein